MSLPADLTDEQRDQLIRAGAQLTAAMSEYMAALAPAVQAMAAGFRTFYEGLQAAGIIDEHGNPVHIGQGENAEDCPACRGTNPPYPFLCPGPPAKDAS
ncbi:hypothetical protein [Streptomyces vinaceus]|uniref:hypothetical protein n=1 Tax=Streptomyces vinaceus TaxID=1960 RepID=UPI0036B7AC20